VSLVNFTTREITCKIVYYGPGRSGKTTNLHYIYGQVPDDRKGKMVSLATQTDRTLFFDFLPLDLGSISGFTTKFQLYTVPGQVYYQATRRLVLQGADGVVFVADSQARQLDENIESFQDLHANLAEQGVDPVEHIHRRNACWRLEPLVDELGRREIAVTVEQQQPKQYCQVIEHQHSIPHWPARPESRDKRHPTPGHSKSSPCDSGASWDR